MEKHAADNKASSSNPGKNNYMNRVFPIRKALARPFQHKLAPELEVDDNIVLKSLQTEDVDRLYKLVESNRNHLQVWLTWINQIQTLADTRNFVKQVKYKNIYAGRWIYGVWYKSDLVGLIDFNEGEKSLNQVSIGYWLAADMQGKGIITRSVKSCLDYVFENLKINRVLIKCASGNEKSQRVPNRLHFSWDGIEVDAGTLHGESVDLVVYSMLYRDWVNVREL